MATAGKSDKKNGQMKTKRKPPATLPGRDPFVDAMPGDRRPPLEARESPRETIQELAAELLKHPVEWLDHPNPQFGGRTPNELIAAGEGDRVYNLLRCAELGLF